MRLVKVSIVLGLLFAFNHVQATTQKDIDAIMNQNDYYAILGVARDAREDVIEQAYRRLSMQYDPIKVPDVLRSAATQALEKINEAYQILRDADIREAYDDGLLSLEEPLSPEQQKIWDDYTRDLNAILRGYQPWEIVLEALRQLSVNYKYEKMPLLPKYSSTLLRALNLRFALQTGLLELELPHVVPEAERMKKLFNVYYAPYLQKKAQQLFDEADKKVNADEKIKLYKEALDEIFYVAFFNEDVRSLYVNKYRELIDSLINQADLAKARQEYKNLKSIIFSYFSTQYFPLSSKDFNAVYIDLSKRLPEPATTTIDQLRQNFLELEVGLASLAQALK